MDRKEWLTDIEKRILFAALSREKKFCMEVDKHGSYGLTPISLEYVCKSLENKFYYDRLFKQMEKEIRSDVIDECKEVINNVFRDYRNDFNLGVTCVDMHNSINKKIEQLKEVE